MGVEQFSSTVRGQGGVLQTNTSGTIETDNYPTGDGFDVADGDLTLNPAATIQELIVTGCGPECVATITTTGGDTFEVPLRGATAVFDKWETDSVVFSDPGNDRLTGGWAGE